MTALRGLFVTGTDTGVGKTWAACGLIVALRRRGLTVLGMKPVASGCAGTPLRNEDAMHLRACASVPTSYAVVNPYAFEPPIAPHIAAREAGVEVRFARIRTLAERLAQQADRLVVEGVGGWRVPLGRDGDVGALAAALGLPVVLVVGLRLGCLNHALLSAEAIAADRLVLTGWIANRIDPQFARWEENLDALRSGIAAPCLGVIPFMAGFRPEAVADCLVPESGNVALDHAGQAF